MNLPVRIERHGELARIVIDHPPVNALAQPVRAQLLAAIEQLDQDADVRAIVLHGAGRAFIAGADVRELDEPPKPPLLKDVLKRLEECAKPVVAALHGAVLGGGAELALACHYRCATPDLQWGFPEIKLGLLPGAGATAWLPRLVGVSTALDLMSSGEPIGVERAVTLGLLDRRLAADAAEEGLAYAKELLAAGAPVRRTRDRPLPDLACATAAFFQGYPATLPRATPRLAAQSIVRSVEVAVEQPFEAAVSFAQARFQECRESVPSRALRHLFWAERPARIDPGRVSRVQSVAIIGAGTMGTGIAAAFARAGFEVSILDREPEALDAALERVSALFDSAVKRGRMTAEDAAASQARVRKVHGWDALRGADLVVEAVFEDLGLKETLFAQISPLCRPGALLATNTSTLDVSLLAAAARRPQDLVGMHFFSPAHLMRLVEIVETPQSSQQSLSTALSVVQRLGKTGVVVRNAFGFVGNRMLYAYGREKEQMMLEGASPEQIDQALEAFGMAMGPNAVGDLAGLDVGVKARRQWTERPDDPCYHRVSEMLVEKGRLGQKSGRGFYRYDAQKHRQSDPEVIDLIRAEAQRLGIPQRTPGNAEILERSLLALIHEGARLLESGIARSGADIDVIWCNGYGFPRGCGGPMFYADTLGLAEVLRMTARYRAQLEERHFTPAPLIERLYREKGRLAEFKSAC